LQAASRLIILNIAAWLSAAVALGSLFAGCGSGTGSSSSVTTAAAPSTVPPDRTVQIVMRSLAFNPPAINAKIGQKVTWINEDNAPHNVTYVSGPRFRSSRPKLRPGARFTVTVNRMGTIHYYCSIHPWMTATINVAR
jgi:plastocyanin